MPEKRQQAVRGCVDWRGRVGIHPTGQTKTQPGGTRAHGSALTFLEVSLNDERRLHVDVLFVSLGIQSFTRLDKFCPMMQHPSLARFFT